MHSYYFRMLSCPGCHDLIAIRARCKKDVIESIRKDRRLLIHFSNQYRPRLIDDSLFSEGIKNGLYFGEDDDGETKFFQSDHRCLEGYPYPIDDQSYFFEHYSIYRHRSYKRLYEKCKNSKKTYIHPLSDDSCMIGEHLVIYNVDYITPLILKLFDSKYSLCDIDALKIIKEFL